MPDKDAGIAFDTVIDLMQERARSTPDALALSVAERSISCAELAAMAERCAAGLAELGVGKGDRVATMLFNCIEQVVVWFGAARIGAIWVPLNVGLMGEDLLFTINDAAPKVLVSDADCAPKFVAIEHLVRAPLKHFTTAEQTKAGAAPATGSAPFAELLSDRPTAPPVLARGEPAVIIYTGGTTGMPKGVVLPHFAWIAAAQRYIEAFEIGPDDCHFSVLPMFHVSGSMIGFLGPYLAGIPTHFDRWFSVSTFWQRVRQTGATIIDPIGTMVTLLCQREPDEADRAHRVRSFLAVLAQVPKQVAEEFPVRFGIQGVNVYSLSESGGTLIVHSKAGAPNPLSNGRGWDWCEIRIADEADRAMAPHETGEILLRPKQPYTFMLGYYNNPERTIETFRNLWLHTGDLGYLDDAGELFFTGRQAHWLRCRGENVSAYEVENLISRYPGVQEVIVVGVPAALGDEDVKAFIIAQPGIELDPAAIVFWCKERMAAFKLPRYIVFASDFPRSTTKREVERHKLKAQSDAIVWDAEVALGGRGYRNSAARTRAPA